MASGSTVTFDRGVLGKEVAGEPFIVTKEQILEYCRVIGETNPLYTDEQAGIAGPHGGIIAPPGFFWCFPSARSPDPKLQFGNFIIGGGRSCEYLAPIRPGDVLTAYASVEDIYSKTGRSGTMVFVLSRYTYRNQHGNIAVIVRHSMVHRDMSEQRTSHESMGSEEEVPEGSE